MQLTLGIILKTTWYATLYRGRRYGGRKTSLKDEYFSIDIWGIEKILSIFLHFSR